MLYFQVFYAAHSSHEGKWVPSRWLREEAARHWKKHHLHKHEDPGAVAYECVHDSVIIIITIIAIHLHRHHLIITFVISSIIITALCGCCSELRVEGGVHPLVFPARNGHASYPRPDAFTRFLHLADGQGGRMMMMMVVVVVVVVVTMRRIRTRRRRMIMIMIMMVLPMTTTATTAVRRDD
jgi:hypothetical protein